MKIRRRLALGLAWASLAPCVFSQRPDQDVRALAAFQTALQQDGFDVKPGATVALNFVALWCAGTPLPGYSGALYSNDQKYLQLMVPKSAQDPTPVNPFQVGPMDAVVLIGLTPPPERYFAFQPFLRYKAVPGEPKKTLWTTLGDSISSATVKTTGRTPFNSPVAMIFTPDQGTEARVRKALERAGYPAAIINTAVFPASMLNLGSGAAADEFSIVLRNALWQKESDGDAYIKNPPFHLFRVTQLAKTAANPFPAPRLLVRGTGQGEMDLMNKLDHLREGIIRANPGLSAKDYQTQVAGYEGYDYMQRGVDPWGDSRDALFLVGGYMPEYGSTDKITLDDGEFLMIYGVNHAATGKATYHNFNVYESMVGKVPLGSADDRTFSGTASQYLPNDAAANSMYAYKVSRDCAGERNCVTLAIENCSQMTIGKETVLGLIFRMYMEPATKVGAAMPEVLYDRVMKFSPRPGGN
jgi:hypothetical protein